MEDLLSKIYDRVAFYEKDSIQLAMEFDGLVNELLKPLEETGTESETEEIRELIYNASYAAEKCGFRLGVQFMVKILEEIMKTGEE